jgi:hypothetical protein
MLLRESLMQLAPILIINNDLYKSTDNPRGFFLFGYVVIGLSETTRLNV